MHTFIVGLGRSGRELHLPVLLRLRHRFPELFSVTPPIGFDVRPADVPDAGRDRRDEHPGIRTAGSLAAARAQLDPAATLVHVCTPPGERAGVLTDLGELGFVNVLVEKPLADTVEALEELASVREKYGLRMAVVAPWLHSSLTERLAAIVESNRFGPLRHIGIRQHKPRIHRTLNSRSHDTAFDVEPPHAVGVMLRLAGDAEVAHAALTDVDVGGRRVPGMGGAELTLRHGSGAVSQLECDLTSPRRERRVELAFESGRVVGHYPVSSEDHYAHLTVSPVGGTPAKSVFPDLALDACLLDTYRHFAGTGGDDAALDAQLQRQMRVVRLLDAAKHMSGSRTESLDVG
ncbi:Gfo/Idh/MocA family protein [Streptomyces sp. 184]|uniref:Gfo/Idh/MocA family protein n=1 Tax=Streptomyces sp. 184 TaxID=1827526 RepID=UPI003892245A